MSTTEQLRDAAVNEFLQKVEHIPGHGPATPRELQLASVLYLRAFREGRESRLPALQAAQAVQEQGLVIDPGKYPPWFTDLLEALGES